MLATERQQQIINKIKSDGGVTVEELANEYEVSLMTIRRDLEYLSSQGIIERCHGGAIAKTEEPYSEKIEHREDEKELIATKALDFIKDGDCIFLDAGTTNLCLAKKLGKFKNLTVITNDLEIGYLVRRYNFDLMLCGGRVQKATSCTLGDYTNQMLSEIKTDVAFIGAASIDKEFEVLTPTENKVIYKRQVIRNATQSFLLVDASKFNQKAMRCINKLSDYTGVITTYSFSTEELKKIDKEHIYIIKA